MQQREATVKSSSLILSSALLTMQFANAEESAEYCEQKNVRVYAGPDLFWDHFDMDYTNETEELHLNSDTFYGGAIIGYDRIATDELYIGGEGKFAIGRTEIEQRSRRYGSHKKYHKQKANGSPLLANLEQRLGYSFQSPIACGFSLAPFVGIGWYYSRLRFNDPNHSINWLYVAVGLRGDQQFLDNFDVGFRLKGMYTFAGSRKTTSWDESNIVSLKNTWGYEFSLPFTWHLDCDRKWDIQLQPYLLKLNVKGTNLILGARVEAGYVF